MKVVIGTRGSDLAVRQSEPLVAHLAQKGVTLEWRKFSTHGDRWQAGPLDKEEGTGFFTRELEEALLAGEVDLLIHSFKDVALQRPEGIVTACVPPRENPVDLLVMREDAPDAPVIGTSAERRRRFLEKAFPDASFTWIRGNVPTRLRRVRDGVLRDEPLHGTILAAAGLHRLGLDLSGLKVRPLNPEELIPAPAQGALLAETRGDRPDILAALKDFHHPETARRVVLERGVLAGIGGGCQQPLGALATLREDGRIHLQAAFAGDTGILHCQAEGSDDGAVLDQVLKGLGFRP